MIREVSNWEQKVMAGFRRRLFWAEGISGEKKFSRRPARGRHQPFLFLFGRPVVLYNLQLHGVPDADCFPLVSKYENPVIYKTFEAFSICIHEAFAGKKIGEPGLKSGNGDEPAIRDILPGLENQKYFFLGRLNNVL